MQYVKERFYWNTILNLLFGCSFDVFLNIAKDEPLADYLAGAIAQLRRFQLT
jgi:hypothetical protein